MSKKNLEKVEIEQPVFKYKKKGYLEYTYYSDGSGAIYVDRKNKYAPVLFASENGTIKTQLEDMLEKIEEMKQDIEILETAYCDVEKVLWSMKDKGIKIK